MDATTAAKGERYAPVPQAYGTDKAVTRGHPEDPLDDTRVFRVDPHCAASHARTQSKMRVGQPKSWQCLRMRARRRIRDCGAYLQLPTREER